MLTDSSFVLTKSISDSFMCLHGPRLEQVLHTHVYIEYLTRAVGREGLVSDIWIPTPKDYFRVSGFQSSFLLIHFRYRSMHQNRDL